MSGGSAIIPWVVLATALGFGVAWLALRGRNKDGTREEREKLRDLLAQESKTAREELRDNLNERMGELNKRQTDADRSLREQLEAMRNTNEEKIEGIRKIVSEKLQETLNQRIEASFKPVADSLQKVHEGLGAMNDLAKDVGGLKSILAGVRTRGLQAEFQLEALLDEALSPGQYEKNVNLGGKQQTVEFAICLPDGEDGGPLYLPLDCKYPLDRWKELANAQEDAESRGTVDKMRKAFFAELKKQAKEISKYISPPKTTNFALMYLPVEGMYAEALRSDIWTEIRQESSVVIVGPTTLYALLHSLQMGFKSIAVSKRSTEVWKILHEVGREFRKLEEEVGKLGTHLERAGNTLRAVETSSQRMKGRLAGVEEIGDDPDPARDAEAHLSRTEQ